jgi:hypothetical protein
MATQSLLLLVKRADDGFGDKVFLSSTFFRIAIDRTALKTIEIPRTRQGLDVVKAKARKFAIDVQKVMFESGIPAEFSEVPGCHSLHSPRTKQAL